MQTDTTLVEPPASLRGPVLAGLIVVAVAFGGLGGWAATAPLASAVAAPGVVSVAGGRKAVQHMEGGVVREVLVSEGRQVRAGEVLVRLDPVQAAATAARLRQREAAARATVARLEAQRDGAATVRFPAQLRQAAARDPTVAGILDAERRAFAEAGRIAAGQTAAIDQRIASLTQEIAALADADAARATEAVLLRDELAGMRDLREKGLVTATRVRSLERGLAHLEKEAAGAVADRARAEAQLAEAHLHRAQVDQAAREKAAAELGEARLEVADVAAQRAAAEDVLARTEIRAPQGGRVQGLAVRTVGGVVRPGELLMEIVPDEVDLVIEAHVPTTDIDRVLPGQDTEIRFPGLHDRNLTLVEGAVQVISPDRRVDERSGLSFYAVTVTVPAGPLAGTTEHLLKAGMPAEVMIRTGERTALDYVLEPLQRAMGRALNEE